MNFNEIQSHKSVSTVGGRSSKSNDGQPKPGRKMNKYEMVRQREINNQNEILLKNLIEIANRRQHLKKKLNLKSHYMLRSMSGSFSQTGE
jgi:hypothetical protein